MKNITAKKPENATPPPVPAPCLEPGWVLRPPATTPGKLATAFKHMELLPEGWNVPIAESPAKLLLNSPAVAIAENMDQATIAIKELLHATCAIGIVAPDKIPDHQDKAREVKCAVKNTLTGRISVVTGYLHSLCHAAEVQYKAPASEATNVQDDTMVISLTFIHGWTNAEAFKSCGADPVEGAKRWLKHIAGVVWLDVWASRRQLSQGDRITALARIPSIALAGLLRKSGREGVDIWEVLPVEQRSSPSRWRVVWLPHGTTQEAAQRQADRIGHLGWGVVTSHRDSGPGVRVLADEFRQASNTLLGSEESKRLCAQRYIISDVPLGWGRPAMEAALAGMPWQASIDGAPHHNPLNHTRSWYVRAEQPPPKPMIHHACGLSPIQQQGGDGPNALVRKREAASTKNGNTYVWRPGKGKGSGKPVHTSFPAAWSDARPQHKQGQQKSQASPQFRQGPDLTCSEVSGQKCPTHASQTGAGAMSGLLPPTTDDPMLQPSAEDYAQLGGKPTQKVGAPSNASCAYVAINSDEEGELIPVLPPDSASNASALQVVMTQMAAMASAVQALQTQIAQLQQTPSLPAATLTAQPGPLALAAPPPGPLALAAGPSGIRPEPAAPPQSGRGRKVHIDGADPEARKLAEEEAKRRRTNTENA